MSPADIVCAEIPFKEFEVPKAADTVIVGQIHDGGLISYRKADGTYLHTLNTIEGFERKLAQLGIRL
ncbi:MAG TPA: hypothetical protein VIL74_14655 [Pyrinomonadaceae bacterium]